MQTQYEPTHPWVYWMIDEIGVEEWPGDQHNPRIVHYLEHTPVGRWAPYDETPWCGAFQAYGMAMAYIDPPENAHRARGWLKWGSKTDPVLGAVCILQARKRATGRRTGSARGGYHVGTVLDRRPGAVQLISGNVSDKVGIDWFDERRWKNHGYRWPW